MQMGGCQWERAEVKSHISAILEHLVLTRAQPKAPKAKSYFNQKTCMSSTSFANIALARHPSHRVLYAKRHGRTEFPSWQRKQQRDPVRPAPSKPPRYIIFLRADRCTR